MSQLLLHLTSACLNGPVEVSVLLPEPPAGETPPVFYQTGKKYRVLWLFHGGRNGNLDWLQNTDIAETAKRRNLIAVIPNGGNSDFANHQEFGEGYRFCDFFFQELMPFIHNWLPASDKKEDNFAAGYSMGSAAVWTYGLLHPEKFGGLIPLSGPPADYRYLEPYRKLAAWQFRELVRKEPDLFLAGYGNTAAGIHQKEVNMIAKYETVGEFLDSEECAWYRLRDAEKKGLPQIYLSGSPDQRLVSFREYAKNLGLKEITWNLTQENTHCFPFWNKALHQAFAFFNI